MLAEIKCDKFIEEPIIFKSGLNSILGDDYSTNSIGKSTLLMIIDFVLGGNSFIDNNSGAINKLGHLVFKFKFKFQSESLYFIRTTSENNKIGICDNEYNVINETDVDSFTDILKNNYCRKVESSFRATINPYSRIWKKDNYYVDKPILNHFKEAESVSIDNLIKLFCLYNEIAVASSHIKSQDETKKILSGMFKKNIVPNITKANFIKNDREIESINKDIEDIKDNLLKYTLNIEELSNKEIIELKTQKQKLLEAQSIILNKIRRLEINLNNTSVKSKYFSRLSQFFENTNETKIAEIEVFHNKISKILKRELEATKEVLDKENETFETQISILDQKIDALLENVQSPKFIVEKIYDLTIQANRLNESNKLYQQKESITQDVKDLNQNLDIIVNKILNEIETLINNELVRINKEIHTEQKKIPRITLRRKSYNYDHSTNTGTGKSYADLIEFDLAILKLTDLPLVIHDSVLFKNVEDKAIDKVIEQYNLFDKQIFIALDGINKFSDKSQKILIDKCALQLSENKKLFNVDWR